jgi:hypothetical protein
MNIFRRKRVVFELPAYVVRFKDDFYKTEAAALSACCDNYLVRIVELEAELVRLKEERDFAGNWDRMLCRKGHQMVSYFSEECPLCKAEADIIKLKKWDIERIAQLEAKEALLDGSLVVACGWIRDAFGGEWREKSDEAIKADLAARWEEQS